MDQITQEEGVRAFYTLNMCRGCKKLSYTIKAISFYICHSCSEIMANFFQNSPIFMKNQCTWCSKESYEKTFSLNFICDSCKMRGCSVCGALVPLQHIFPDLDKCERCSVLSCPKCHAGGLEKKTTVLQEDGSKRAHFACGKPECTGFVNMICPKK